MSDEKDPEGSINATFGDIDRSLVAVGNRITQRQTVSQSPEVTAADRAELAELLTRLEQEVAAQAPPEKKTAALERTKELAEAVTAEKPDLSTLSTMEYVKGWFVKHLPGLAGAVTGVVVHPIVGKLVAAAGDALSAEFRRRFGGN
jgi:hypothetical protein